MDKVCPVCFASADAPVCPHCLANVSLLVKAQKLERSEPESFSALKESLDIFAAEGRKHTVIRVTNRLVDHCLHNGRWLEARAYLEHIIALGARDIDPSLQAAMWRKLGGLLARQGDVELAEHLLERASEAGDQIAAVERVRLAAQLKDVVAALDSVALIDLKLDRNLRSAAWLAEAFARAQDPDAQTYILPVIDAARQKNDEFTLAIAERASGTAHSTSHEHTEAKNLLESALERFRALNDVFEAAQTQVEIAQALMLESADGGRNVVSQATIEKALENLGPAITIFRRLGAAPAEKNAAGLLKALTIGRESPPFSEHTTSGAVAMLWVTLDSACPANIWDYLAEFMQKQQGVSENLLGGMLVLFGLMEPFDDHDVVIESMLGAEQIMSLLAPEFAPSARIVGAVGLLPHFENDMTMTFRSIRHSPLFRRVRVQGESVPPGTLSVDQTLYLATQDHYQFEESEEQGWNRLVSQLSAARSKLAVPISRAQLRDHEHLLKTMDGILRTLQRKRVGGLLSMDGVPGTGKSRILALYEEEFRKHGGTHIISLGGRDSLRYTPFGVILSWLNEVVELDTSFEKRLTVISAFRQAVNDLLESSPVLLTLDDIHLFDSASLEAIEAILPLILTHPLIILLAARPEGRDEWQEIVRAAQRALPQRTLQLTLPMDLARVRHELPEDFEARRVLESAAVLGTHFSTLVLRTMTGVRDLSRKLAEFQTMQFLVPTEDPNIWRFVQSAERDTIYRGINPDYRSVLHWYAWRALEAIGQPTGDHAYHAGMRDKAFLHALQTAENAVAMDSLHEALVHYDRALEHAEGPTVDLILARVQILLQLGNWTSAQETFQFLDAEAAVLAPRDRARILMYRAQLSRRVGEVAALYTYYEQAKKTLSALPQDEAVLADQLDLMYEQAMSRFKRGDVEFARSITGGALLAAQRSDMPAKAARLWELLAKIHRMRGEDQQARRAIEHVLSIRRAAGERWSLAKPLETHGNLLASMGEAEGASTQLEEALDLAVQAGDRDAVIRLHHRLAQLASYRGNFDAMIEHCNHALEVAYFVEQGSVVVYSHVLMTDALRMKGDLVDAFYHVNSAIRLANLYDENASVALAHLALAQVTMAANWFEPSRKALETTIELMGRSRNVSLRAQVYLTQMELALMGDDHDAFNEALSDVRELSPVMSDLMMRGRVNLLVSRQRRKIDDWNATIHEAERAVEAFSKIGATYWKDQALSLLREYAAEAPDYVLGGKYTERKRATTTVTAVKVHDQKSETAEAVAPSSIEQESKDTASVSEPAES